MNDFLSMIEGLDFSKLYQGLDVGPTTLFVGLILVFTIIYGLSLGRTKALISLLGIYVALAFDAAFPYLEQLHNWLPVAGEIYTTRVAVFLVVYLIVFAILNNSFAKGRLTLKETSVVSVAVITNIIPDEIIEKMPEYLSAYFATKQALFYWIIVPIILLTFIRKSKKN